MTIIVDSAGQSVTVGAQDVIVSYFVVYAVEVVYSVVSGGEFSLSVPVTGHTVVYRAIVSVVTDPTGQSVIVGAQDVIVLTFVAKIVDVVYSVVLVLVEGSAEDSEMVILGFGM